MTMHLYEALVTIAGDGSLSAGDLIAYAMEDTIGGRDTGQWPAMCVHEAEGKLIYALVRALKPNVALEIGGNFGCSTTHILAALEANGTGMLVSYDIDPASYRGVPEHLRHRLDARIEDALTADLPAAPFVLEDGEHGLDFTTRILTQLRALNPRCIVSHDYATGHHYDGFFVEEAWNAVLPEGEGYVLDGAFTGVGVWWNR